MMTSDVPPLLLGDDEYHYACSVKQIKEKQQICLSVNNRALALFSFSGHVEFSLQPVISLNRGYYALDARCYHAGGPLWQGLAPLLRALDAVNTGEVGDLEDFGAVVTCPFHSYKLVLATGERVLRDGLTGQLKRVAKRQRTHDVKARRLLSFIPAHPTSSQVKDGFVFVRVSTPLLDGDEFDCDRYATYPVDGAASGGVVVKQELKFTRY